MRRLAAAFWSGRAVGWRIARTAAAFTLLSSLFTIFVPMLFENRLIYFPTRYPDGFWDLDRIAIPDGEVGPSVEDVWFEAEDGVRLHGWHLRPVRPGDDGSAPIPVPTRGVLLWFHGNAGNLSHRYPVLAEMVRYPTEVFIFDYRGYGRSEGSPDEPGLYRDARAAWRHLTERRGVDPARVVLLGKSLGGAPAVQLATEVPCAGLIVQSSFTNARDMGKSMMPFPPAWLFLRTKFDSAEKVARVRAPKLFMHSRADEVVPFRLGRRLFEAAAEPKEFWEIPEAAHNDTFHAAGEKVHGKIREFLFRVLPPPPD